MMRWANGAARPTGGIGVRRAAVAGRFYDDRTDRLAGQVDRQLATARTALRSRASGGRARGQAEQVAGIVVPHAGHVYSGPIAAFAYAALDPARVSRVVILGPAHYVPVPGIGLSTAEAWRTPLGDVPIDRATGDLLRGRFDDVFPANEAHAPEHSLEVQLPFLQRVLGTVGWSLVPLIVGADLPDAVGSVIRTCAELPGTLIVVSTDLSHYLDQHSAREQDDRTIAAVLARRPDDIGVHDACGRYPLRGLLTVAPELGWELDLLDARTSGDTAGSRDRVVGYAAFVAWASDGRGGSTASTVTPAAAETVQPAGPSSDAAPSRAGAGLSPDGRLSPSARAALLQLARDTIEGALVTGRRPRLDLEEWSTTISEPGLTRNGAAFVTLRSSQGDLLGCIGTLAAHQPLAQDVAEHAYDAAFRDPRFPPLTPQRAEGMVIDISVLSRPRPFSARDYDDLLRRLEPGAGVVVTAGRHRATFLPGVWSQLPDPAAFLAALWRKAGLTPGAWPPDTRIEVYSSEEFAESDHSAL
jgi:AmmeMemoRadiSam system protein B/AmmeMemoRadiSam system protein A